MLNKWAIQERTSLDIITIYRKMKVGTFPQTATRAGAASRASRRGWQVLRSDRGAESRVSVRNSVRSVERQPLSSCDAFLGCGHTITAWAIGNKENL